MDWVQIDRLLPEEEGRIHLRYFGLKINTGRWIISKDAMTV
jgi:hypothetical protein